MPFTLTATPKPEYVHITSHGEINSVDEGLVYTTRQLRHLTAHGLKRIFTDERELAINLGYNELMAVAEYWEENELHRKGFRIASLVAPAAQPPQQGYETAARNRSMCYRFFCNEAEAILWLLKGEG